METNTLASSRLGLKRKMLNATIQEMNPSQDESNSEMIQRTNAIANRLGLASEEMKLFLFLWAKVWSSLKLSRGDF